ncbi:hypothetical protein Tco_1019590 [Tanacetum coccineum]|uniref:Uncharacterized protein n=1 Tax=Tanacetum coccineum TaxID=301880 RepID=A0ABQ5FXV8_9ASTR
MGLPATHPDEGISTTKPLPEGTNINPKYSERLKPLVDRDSSTPLVTALSRTNAEYQPDTKTLLLTIVADIQALLVASDEELKDDSDDDSPSPSKEQPQSSKSRKTDASDSESSSCSETLKLYDNYMPIIERKLEVHNVVKEDPALNKKFLEAAEALETDIQQKDKKSSQNGQNRARNGRAVKDKGVENRYMVTLGDGVLANGVVMILEMDIAFYAIQRTETHSLMIRLRILSIILPISHTHLNNPNACHTLVSYVGTMPIMVMIVHLKSHLSTIRTRVSIKTLIIFYKLH